MKIPVKRTAEIYSQKVREYLTNEQVLLVIAGMYGVGDYVDDCGLMIESIEEATKKYGDELKIDSSLPVIWKIYNLAHSKNYNPNNFN